MSCPDHNDELQNPVFSVSTMSDAILLHEGRHPDPFALLGRHGRGDQVTVWALLPGARQARLSDIDQPLQRLADTDVFEWQGLAEGLPVHYRLAWIDDGGHSVQQHSKARTVRPGRGRLQ